MHEIVHFRGYRMLSLEELQIVKSRYHFFTTFPTSVFTNGIGSIKFCPMSINQYFFTGRMKYDYWP